MTRWLIRLLVALSLWNCVPIAQAQDTPPAPQTAEPDADEPTTADIARALQRYRNEPGVRDVVTTALAQQHSDPGRVLALASRARTAGWMPTLRVSARRGQTIDLLAAQSTTTDRNSASTGDDFVLEAQLSFDLAKVVWSTSEPRIEREMRAEREAEQELIRTVTSLYFERRRLQLERDFRGTVAIADELRILEIEGLLDGFTGGTFGRALRRSTADQ